LIALPFQTSFWRTTQAMEYEDQCLLKIVLPRNHKTDRKPPQFIDKEQSQISTFWSSFHLGVPHVGDFLREEASDHLQDLGLLEIYYISELILYSCIYSPLRHENI
jgi:hypothetical protein